MLALRRKELTNSWLGAENCNRGFDIEQSLEIAGLEMRMVNVLALRRKELMNSRLGAGNCNGELDIEKSSEMAG